MEAILNTSIDRGRGFTYSALEVTDDFAAGDVEVIGTALTVIVVEKAAGATVRAASVAAGTEPKPDSCAILYEHEDVKILKNTSLIIAKGDLVFWDVAEGKVNKTASGNYAVGVALEAADTADTTVNIAFDGAHQHLADITGEAATFFGATDMTGAEAETLTDGSNADAKHVHDTPGLTADCIDATLIADNAVGVEHVGAGVIQVDTIEVSSAELVDLETNPKELVAAGGAHTLHELISAVFILDYGGAALVETDAPDDLAICYDDGTGETAWTGDTTGFITNAADAILRATGLDINGDASAVTAAANVNKNLALCNTDSDFTVGASTSTLTVIITYRTVATGTA